MLRMRRLGWTQAWGCTYPWREECCILPKHYNPLRKYIHHDSIYCITGYLSTIGISVIIGSSYFTNLYKPISNAVSSSIVVLHHYFLFTWSLMSYKFLLLSSKYLFRTLVMWRRSLWSIFSNRTHFGIIRLIYHCPWLRPLLSACFSCRLNHAEKCRNFNGTYTQW